MTVVAYAVLLGSALLALYAYVGYPLLLRVLAAGRPRRAYPEPDVWPRISFCLPAYNEEDEIADALDTLLAIDYPSDRRQIIVVSDASTDRTDEIVRGYADRGVELVRQPVRMGKTAAEEVAAEHVDGEIVINSDASVRIASDAVKALVIRFEDEDVGVASSRDVSVTRLDEEQNAGEAGYVGYEMGVREAETRLHGIVGASGSLYAIRTHLHRLPLPANLSRDFAAALHAEENGYRAVSVPEARCVVPRTASLQREYRRKVRTIARGMRTIWHKRHLLDPFRHPVFAWMLWSHKIARWALPWAGVAALVALAALAMVANWAAIALVAATAGLLAGGISWLLAARGRTVPAPLAALAYALMGNVAAMRALTTALRGQSQAVWEPTRRGTASGTTSRRPSGWR